MGGFYPVARAHRPETHRHARQHPLPPVVHPESADDWQFVAKEEFMLDFFTNLDFVLQRIAGHRPSMVMAVARDPSAEDVDGFPHPNSSWPVRHGGRPVHLQRAPQQPFSREWSMFRSFHRNPGSFKSREWAFKLRDTLRQRHPDRDDARCYVWAVWRYTGI